MAQCEYSYRKSNSDDTVRCKLMNKNGDCCAFVKFCRVTHHWENNETYKNCPIRRKGRELKEENKNG